MNKITCNLATVLSKQKMTQTELAKRTGMNHYNIFSYCSGRSFPREEKIAAITAALNIGVSEIWPNIEAEKAAISKRHSDAIRKARAKKKWPCRQPAYKAQKSAESDLRKVRAAVPVDPNDANAVPLAYSCRGGDFRLRPAKTSEDDLQDPRWCREHARRMHKYLVGHCAWGVYSELRQIMATENKLADERAKVAKGREHVG